MSVKINVGFFFNLLTVVYSKLVLLLMEHAVLREKVKRLEEESDKRENKKLLKQLFR